MNTDVFDFRIKHKNLKSLFDANGVVDAGQLLLFSTRKLRAKYCGNYSKCK